MMVVHITRTDETVTATALFNNGAVVTASIPSGRVALTTETALRDYNDDFNNDFNI